MKKQLSLLFFLVSFALSSSALAQTLLIMGDSLSAGYGLSQGEEWPALLQTKLQQEFPEAKYNIINASISGETSQGGFNRFHQLLEQHQPQLVVLELGANDGLRGQSLKQMHNNLNRMIELSLEHKAKVLLLGIRIPPNYGERYSQAFHQVYFDLAKQHSINLVPFFLADIAGNTELMQKDALHPTAEAQPTIINNIWPSLISVLQSKP